jgi:23S rRNA (uracil1939-C5)-methyltransferase
MIELTIQDVAFGGKGVGRDAGGKAVFVPYTIEGETVSAQIVREKKQFAEAELIEIRQNSAYRVEPLCPYFGRCGGCAYQHIEYPHQTEIKWRQVQDLLRRIGKIAEPPMQPIIASPEAYGYRNRITVHVMEGVIGFFRRESNRLIDIERCPISREELNDDLRMLRKSNPADGHYSLRADNAPKIFTQTNDAIAERLRQLVVRLVPENQQLLIDAYCGSGFFAKALLDKFDRIIGIDWDRFAIEEASRDATGKEMYIAGDVAAVLGRTRSGGFPIAELNTATIENRGSLTLIADPPASGLTANVIKTLIDLAPGTFIYVSCNPATLARDLKELGKQFSLQSVTPLDMFPQTAEIEVAVRLQRSASPAMQRYRPRCCPD